MVGLILPSLDPGLFLLFLFCISRRTTCVDNADDAEAELIRFFLKSSLNKLNETHKSSISNHTVIANWTTFMVEDHLQTPPQLRNVSEEDVANVTVVTTSDLIELMRLNESKTTVAVLTFVSEENQNVSSVFDDYTEENVTLTTNSIPIISSSSEIQSHTSHLSLFNFEVETFFDPDNTTSVENETTTFANTVENETKLADSTFYVITETSAVSSTPHKEELNKVFYDCKFRCAINR